jgi:hypothetical protein
MMRREGSGSFLEKKNQKTFLLTWAKACREVQAPRSKRFFAAFFSKKAALTLSAAP